MQFRAEVTGEGGMRVVRVAGRLVRESSAELTSLCEEVSGALRIDLSDLLSVDDAGLETLALLESRGAALVGLSPYLALRLQIARAPRAGQPHDDQRAGRAWGRRTNWAGTTNTREDE